MKHRKATSETRPLSTGPPGQTTKRPTHWLSLLCTAVGVALGRSLSEGLTWLIKQLGTAL